MINVWICDSADEYWQCDSGEPCEDGNCGVRHYADLDAFLAVRRVTCAECERWIGDDDSRVRVPVYEEPNYFYCSRSCQRKRHAGWAHNARRKALLERMIRAAWGDRAIVSHRGMCWPGDADTRTVPADAQAEVTLLDVRMKVSIWLGDLSNVLVYALAPESYPGFADDAERDAFWVALRQGVADRWEAERPLWRAAVDAAGEP